MRVLLCIPCCIALFAGCDDNVFSPKSADFKDRLTVFAILDDSKQVQMIRIQKSYDPGTTNPKDYTGSKEIDTAAITLSDNNRKTYFFRDSLVTEASGTKRKVWLTSSVDLREGKILSLLVQAKGFDPITAKVEIPPKPYIFARSVTAGSSIYGVEVGTTPDRRSYVAKGYLIRLELIGSKTVNGTRVTLRREVPIGVSTDGGNALYQYPTIGRESTLIYPVSHIVTLRDILYSKDGVEQVEAIATGFALDQNFYNYYYTVRGFDDPLTFRQDSPDITNIGGGLGVFGAVKVDSAAFSLTSLIGNQ